MNAAFAAEAQNVEEAPWAVSMDTLRWLPTARWLDATPPTPAIEGPTDGDDDMELKHTEEAAGQTAADETRYRRYYAKAYGGGAVMQAQRTCYYYKEYKFCKKGRRCNYAHF